MIISLETLSKLWNQDSPVSGNKAKLLAANLGSKIVVIYGAGTLTDVARRWKTQINENSKGLAFFETFPELNHNAVAGYRYPETIKGRVEVIMLRCPSLHPRILMRYKITGELLRQNGISMSMWTARASTLSPR